VDVICQRWEQFVGQPAVLHGSGRTFRELARERKSKPDWRISEPWG